MGKKVGIVTGQEVKTYKGVDNTRVLQVALYGQNPESVVYINNSGEDTAPVNGAYVVVREIADDKYTFGIRDLLPLESDPGEKEFYSYDDSGKLARLKLKLDGSVGIKNETEGVDFLTAFTAYNLAIKNIVDTGGDSVNPAIKTALDNALADVLKFISCI